MKRNISLFKIDSEQIALEVALTNEGEIASAIARNLNNGKITIVDTSAKIIKEEPVLNTYNRSYT